ncbi:hypothetical protein GCM10008938_44400 [Deinococcus roseus]|uniref:Transposase DDE domain-containing protein n=1 Tax=Deinococcus roseus TaxID=392414 RepID=A0ABQ2DGD2_9DEIO|nr:hypothetical protein GCM10008938_44400 [Deinococcus roseus]
MWDGAGLLTFNPEHKMFLLLSFTRDVKRLGWWVSCCSNLMQRGFAQAFSVGAPTRTTTFSTSGSSSAWVLNASCTSLKG